MGYMVILALWDIYRAISMNECAGGGGYIRIRRRDITKTQKKRHLRCYDRVWWLLYLATLCAGTVSGSRKSSRSLLSLSNTIFMFLVNAFTACPGIVKDVLWARSFGEPVALAGALSSIRFSGAQDGCGEPTFSVTLDGMSRGRLFSLTMAKSRHSKERKLLSASKQYCLGIVAMVVIVLHMSRSHAIELIYSGSQLHSQSTRIWAGKPKSRQHRHHFHMFICHEI